MKKNFLLAAFLTAFVFIVAGCSGRNADFGYVDMQRVVAESAKVKELQEQIQLKAKEFDELAEKERASLSAEEYQRNQQLRRGEITALGKDIEGQFETILNKAMAEVAKDKGLGAVLAKNSVLHGGTDVTDDVLKKIN
ncbi:MAG: OmpH family outer membrane protein [Acidaminococcales bacterium]|jgi:outer membrane protein|nr:OmpH family outer membrane protein [Acidaminococcales bacterium]